MSSKKFTWNIDFSQAVNWMNNYASLPLMKNGKAIKKNIAQVLGITPGAIPGFEKKGIPAARIVKFAQEKRASLDLLLNIEKKETNSDDGHRVIDNKTIKDVLAILEKAPPVKDVVYNLLNRRFRNEPVENDRRKP